MIFLQTYNKPPDNVKTQNLWKTVNAKFIALNNIEIISYIHSNKNKSIWTVGYCRRILSQAGEELRAEVEEEITEKNIRIMRTRLGRPESRQVRYEINLGKADNG